MEGHHLFMEHALNIAEKGLGHVSPNPLVGCVIVKDGVIVSEGYHQKYGEAHAEVNAIACLPKEINPCDCTLYVNLEPCSHHGKTPPCADLIIHKGFKKVVISNIDPNPLVSGKGIEKLKQSGVEVITDILKEEGRFLNRRFFTFHEKKRPYVVLKWAQTADGFISKWPVPENRQENMISGEASLRVSHQLRASEDAILIGKNTVITDNPELTSRLAKGKNPIRVILADALPDYQQYKVFNNQSKTIWYNAEEDLTTDLFLKVKTDSNPASLGFILNDLYHHKISSVIVEGGSKVLNSFLLEGLWDEKWVFVNPDLYFGRGIKAPDFEFYSDYQIVGADKFYVIYSKSII